MHKARLLPLLAVGASAYLAYPYVTLYWIGDAIRHGDAESLQKLVEWDDVREGIKEDICDFVMEDPAPGGPATDGQAPGGPTPGGQATAAVDTGRLPPFGASFVRGIASNAIDSTITAENLAHAGQSTDAAQVASSDPVHVEWAFFDGARSFHVDMRANNARHDLIRLRMELRHGRWEVTRVWLPVDMLSQTSQRT